jgi:hypothetical protein
MLQWLSLFHHLPAWVEIFFFDLIPFIVIYLIVDEEGNPIRCQIRPTKQGERLTDRRRDPPPLPIVRLGNELRIPFDMHKVHAFSSSSCERRGGGGGQYSTSPIIMGSEAVRYRITNTVLCCLFNIKAVECNSPLGGDEPLISLAWPSPSASSTRANYSFGLRVDCLLGRFVLFRPVGRVHYWSNCEFIVCRISLVICIMITASYYLLPAPDHKLIMCYASLCLFPIPIFDFWILWFEFPTLFGLHRVLLWLLSHWIIREGWKRLHK